MTSLDKLLPSHFGESEVEVGIRRKDWERIWFSLLDIERDNHRGDYPLSEIRLEIPDAPGGLEWWINYNHDEPDTPEILHSTLGLFFVDKDGERWLGLNVELRRSNPGVLYPYQPPVYGAPITTPAHLTHLRDFITRVATNPKSLVVAEVIES
jgi:hypothetical protein